MTNIAYDVTNQEVTVGDIVLGFQRVSNVCGQVTEVKDNGELVLDVYTSMGWVRGSETLIAANRCILMMSASQTLLYPRENLRKFYAEQD